MKLLVIALAACGDGGQSLHDAVALACETPPAISEIHNREAIEALTAMVAASPVKRGARLAELMTRAGLTSCNKYDVNEIARVATYFDVVPPLSSRPCAPARLPTVRIERNQVVVGDRIASGVPAGDLADKVSFELDASGIENAIIVVDREVDGRVLADVIGAIASANPHTLELVVDAGSCTGSIALAVGWVTGEHAPWCSVELRATGISVVMSQLSGDRVHSSDAGRSVVRKIESGDLPVLQAELERRLRQVEVTGEVKPSTLTIEVAAGVPAQQVLDTIVAVMHDASGNPLFSRIKLAVLD